MVKVFSCNCKLLSFLFYCMIFILFVLRKVTKLGMIRRLVSLQDIRCSEVNYKREKYHFKLKNGDHCQNLLATGTFSLHLTTTGEIRNAVKGVRLREGIFNLQDLSLRLSSFTNYCMSKFRHGKSLIGQFCQVREKWTMSFGQSMYYSKKFS